MLSKSGDHQTVPLSVLLKRELVNEKIERPEISHGQASQSKKGEDFTFIKTECQRVLGDGVTTYSVFALFDGHNGSAAAIYTKENLLTNILSAIPPDLSSDEWVSALPRALVAGFVKTDKDFQERAQTSGTTVTFVIIEGWVITVASVGDSRAILESAEGDIHYLSADHRLDCSEEERERITASGGEVGRLNTGGGTEIGPLRCWPGGLCLSRSIGDMDVGEFIVPVPYVKQVKLSSTGGRLIVSSDGVWDALSAETAFECCRGMPPDAAASEIVKEAVQLKGLRDDTTCIVIDIQPPEKPDPPKPPPKKQGKRVFKSMFRQKHSESSSQTDKEEFSEPDVVEELVEEGSVSLSERMESNDVEEEEFGFSRNYFLAKELRNSGKKSARKLSDFNLVDEQELREAYANIDQKHEKEISNLINSYKDSHKEWVYVLRCGFGLLMYGFGSKKALIEDFASTALRDYSVLVINGYLQPINLKQVVGTLAELLRDQLKMKQRSTSGNHLKNQQPFNTQSLDDLISFLDGSHLEDEECSVCLIVNNIDGPGLRDSETQQYLARIAACSHVRMVASIDHVNAPLLWDKKMVHTQFNWYWLHVPTYAPYKVEGMFFPLILTNSGNAQNVKTASIVLQSLTPNAQNVFKVLADHQLSHPDEEGMPFNNLYTICRERFLVSSQITLNAHLTEFKDHELFKTRRNSDGEDCLYIPLTNDALEKLAKEISQ